MCIHTHHTYIYIYTHTKYYHQALKLSIQSAWRASTQPVARERCESTASKAMKDDSHRLRTAAQPGLHAQNFRKSLK